MDHAMEIRQEIIASVPAPSVEARIQAMQASHAQKRIAAINYLGERWCLHPLYSYEANPHHSPSVRRSAVLAVTQSAASNEGRI